MIRILIAHSSRLVCDSLRNALEKQANVSVAGCASNEEELTFLLPHANVVLMGTELGNSNICTLLRDIRLTYPSTKVILVGVANDPQQILRYIESGIAGYILAEESLEQMVHKVEAATQGKALVSPLVAALMMERAAFLAHRNNNIVFFDAKQSMVNELTPREQEVLDLISEGYTNKAIADELVIECGTVKNHVHNILRKLETATRHEAVALYQAAQHSQNILTYA